MLSYQYLVLLSFGVLVELLLAAILGLRVLGVVGLFL